MSSNLFLFCSNRHFSLSASENQMTRARTVAFQHAIRDLMSVISRYFLCFCSKNFYVIQLCAAADVSIIDMCWTRTCVRVWLSFWFFIWPTHIQYNIFATIEIAKYHATIDMPYGMAVSIPMLARSHFFVMNWQLRKVDLTTDFGFRHFFRKRILRIDCMGYQTTL